MINRKVVVSGMGILSSFGLGVDTLLQALKTADCKISIWNEAKKDDADIISVGAKMQDFSLNSALEELNIKDEKLKNLAKEVSRRSDKVIQSAVLASLEAYQSAGLDEHPVQSERMGVIVAGSNISQNYLYKLFEKYHDKIGFVTPSHALHFMDTNLVGVLSELFAIKGEGYNIGGASASGNVGLIKGWQMIQSGLTDCCMVVAPMTELSSLEFAAFHNLNAMGGKKYADKPLEASRPFDASSEGFIYGQASACIILETEKSAKQRGIEPVADFLGGAQCLDGNRLSDPSLEGEIRIMEEVIKLANIDKKDINYVNAHGTSTPLGDKTEIQAIKQVFHDALGEICVNSTKGITGHCLYSAGVVEAIASILQMQHGFVHPNRNLEEPIDDAVRLVQQEERMEIKYTLSNSFGFGGIDTCIVLGKR